MTVLFSGPVLDQLNAATNTLKKGGVPNARWHAELLLGSVLELARHELYLQATDELPVSAMVRFADVVARRSRGEPTQYLIGSTEFYGLHFKCDRRALIPRPETEHVVEAALWRLGENRGTGLKILELGTGSGCIAVTLAVHLPEAEILATDISSAALELASENAQHHRVDDRIEFRRSDLCDDVIDQYDVRVANLPYVSSLDRKSLQREIRDWEPEDALFAGPDGLAVLRATLESAPAHLRDGGQIILEIGLGQDSEVEQLAERSGRYSRPEWRNDYQGTRRVFCAHKV